MDEWRGGIREAFARGSSSLAPRLVLETQSGRSWSMGSGMLADLKAKCESSVEAPTRRGVTIWEVAVFVYCARPIFSFLMGHAARKGVAFLSKSSSRYQTRRDLSRECAEVTYILYHHEVEYCWHVLDISTLCVTQRWSESRPI